MPIEPFDFTYTLNSEESQNQALQNLVGTTSRSEYTPISSFFVKPNVLATPVAANYVTDAFGPILDASSTTVAKKFRTTSFVRATNTSLNKVYAICSGQVLIQPSYTNGVQDVDKINIVLKPSASFAPLKIKYFIYRGINKSDLIDSSLFLSLPNLPDAPDFLKKLWNTYKAYVTSIIDPSTGDPLPEPAEFLSSMIGYDENQVDTTLIEHCFTKKGSSLLYQIPLCSKGEYLGNFTGSIGLDIVLDNGDNETINQTELFKLNLAFARVNNHVLDTDSLTTRKNQYKESILQFMDSAAFWGSHIKCGKLSMFDVTTTNFKDFSSNSDIYSKAVNKYQTKNKLYVYVTTNENRSYNFTSNARTVQGFSATQKCRTLGWPIIIQELTLSTAPATLKSTINFNLEYDIDTSVPELERHVCIDVITHNNKTSTYPRIERPLNPTGTLPAYINGRTKNIPIGFNVNGTKSCAGFLMIFANLPNGTPYIKNYYNDLFPVNFGPTFDEPLLTESQTYWVTSDKNRLVNLDEVLDIGAVIQNKLVYDTGKSQAIAPALPILKRRKLYMALLKRNTINNAEYNDLNIDKVTAGIVKVTKNKEDYFHNLYNDFEFSVYKGTFTDTTAIGTSIINSLALTHECSFTKKNSFFHLGITEEEYNKLIYDNAVVQSTQLVPLEAENMFFHLEEDLTFTHQNVRKYKLGIDYEDVTWTIQTVYPSTANEVYVYSIDGFYFFSKEFSELQEFYSEFAKAKVEFRTIMDQTLTYDHDSNSSTPPIPLYNFNPSTSIPTTVTPYNGEYGFDWLRVGDNGEQSYESIIQGGYERPTPLDINTEFELNTSSPATSDEAFRALKREYKSIPTQINNDQYFVPYLNLFSKTFSDSLPATVSPRPPYEANLRVLVTIDEIVGVGKLMFDYDTNLFTIDKPILSDKLHTSKIESIDKTIKITCLKDFSVTQQIRVLAYPVGVTDRNQAMLAGMIILKSNDLSVRKSANFVLVTVNTNINGTPEQGVFMSAEVTNLRNILHQGLITANIIQDPSINIDLTGHVDFHQKFNATLPTVKIDGGFINNAGGVATYNFSTGEKIHQFLKNRFLNVSSNNIYRNYFIVFSFDAHGKTNSILGHVDGIGKHLVVMYRSGTRPSTEPRDLTTLNHESMHGLGLYHTHRDSLIVDPQIKYIYHKINTNISISPLHLLDITDNVMSYNSNGIVLWEWQKQFINLK